MHRGNRLQVSTKWRLGGGCAALGRLDNQLCEELNSIARSKIYAYRTQTIPLAHVQSKPNRIKWGPRKRQLPHTRTRDSLEHVLLLRAANPTPPSALSSALSAAVMSPRPWCHRLHPPIKTAAPPRLRSQSRSGMTRRGSSRPL